MGYSKQMKKFLFAFSGCLNDYLSLVGEVDAERRRVRGVFLLVVSFYTWLLRHRAYHARSRLRCIV
jgi:hypothetical protein